MRLRRLGELNTVRLVTSSAVIGRQECFDSGGPTFRWLCDLYYVSTRRFLVLDSGFGAHVTEVFGTVVCLLGTSGPAATTPNCAARRNFTVSTSAGFWFYTFYGSIYNIVRRITKLVQNFTILSKIKIPRKF